MLLIVNCNVRRAHFQPLHECSKTVGRPDFARNCWRAHNAPPDPLAGCTGPLRGGRGGRQRQGGKGREGKDGNGSERKKLEKKVRRDGTEWKGREGGEKDGREGQE
jgi:hypothetical protein